MLLALALGLIALVGLSLGLLGGGGSILAVPVLVYVARLAPADAIPLSLLIVGASAVAGGIAHHRAGAVDWRTTLWFAAPGLVTAYLGARLTRRVPAPVLLWAFAVLTVGVGVWMLLGTRARPPRPDRTPPRGRAPRRTSALIAGAAVGGVTGLLGVGGGFLIVPALIAFTGIGIRQAVGTSLAIIALNSAAAFLGHLGEHTVRWPLAVGFTALAVIGARLGARLGRIVPAETVRGVFATMVLVIGVAMVVRSSFGG